MVCGGGVYSALSQVWLLTGAAVELLRQNEQPQIILTQRQSTLNQFSLLFPHTKLRTKLSVRKHLGHLIGRHTLSLIAIR